MLEKTIVAHLNSFVSNVAGLPTDSLKIKAKKLWKTKHEIFITVTGISYNDVKNAFREMENLSSGNDCFRFVINNDFNSYEIFISGLEKSETTEMVYKDLCITIRPAVDQYYVETRSFKHTIDEGVITVEKLVVNHQINNEEDFPAQYKSQLVEALRTISYNERKKALKSKSKHKEVPTNITEKKAIKQAKEIRKAEKKAEKKAARKLAHA